MMCWNGMIAVLFGRGKPSPPGMLKLFYQNDLTNIVYKFSSSYFVDRKILD